MTDNIEKLYELAKIDKYDYELAKYPDFTDTKQLELIKFLGKRKIIFSIFKGRLFWEFDCFNAVYSTDEDFSQALAGFVCSLWPTLTKTQREEIKEILE